MKISWMTFALVVCFSSFAFSSSGSSSSSSSSSGSRPISKAKVVTHIVTEDETAWFLAQVYYGSGLEFPKLLASNKLARAEDMKQGMTIRIENPKFFKEQSQFASRYNRLWEQRQKSLGLQVGSALPHSKVVIPTEKIRTQDNTPKLPFAETYGKEQLNREPASASTKENDAN